MLIWINALAGVLATAYFSGRAYSSLMQSDVGFLGTFGKAISRKQLIFLRVLLTSLLAIVGILIIATDADLRNSRKTIWLVAAGTAILAFLAPGPVTVNPQGLLRTNNFRRDTLIQWEELDHYTIKTGSWGVPNVYCFHATDGRSINVNDWTQSGQDLLNQIRQHKSLPERRPNSNS